jgi:hypothetical protein
MAIPRKELAKKLIVGLEGPWPTPQEEAWLALWRPRGVILFFRNILNSNQLSLLCRRLRELLPDLEISADQEGGPVSPLAAAIGRPPSAWGLGMLDDPELTRAVHRETGDRMRSLGLDRVWGPVADVMFAPENPVIGVRAFGSDPDLVTRHVVAALSGLAEGGVATCLKHWPGHGSSTTDSHHGPADAESRGAQSLVFRAGLAAGASALMIGHLGSPPATLDRARLADLRSEAASGSARLRPELFADDISMGALREPMAERGVMLPDSAEAEQLGQGMVDPGILPLSWFQELLASGLDCLLLRGLPLVAFPLPAEAVSSPGRSVGLAGPAFVEAEGNSYSVARRLLAALLARSFRPKPGPLAWLDATAEDRWEVADHGKGNDREAFMALVSGLFQVQEFLAEGQSPLAAPCSHLLVTSHRPLSPGFDRALSGLSPTGECLVAGHPHLASQMVEVLGSGWIVTSCPDVDWKILALAFQQP